MSQIFKPFVTQHFFDIRDFFTIANPDFELQERMKVAFARMIPKSSDPDALGLKHAAQEVQDVVGLPFNQWHAGHLASLKGKTLPAWDKQETTVLALQSLDNLLELEKRKMETMSQLKCVLVGQALMHYAALYGEEVEAKMNSFNLELQRKAKDNPLVFLEHFALNRFEHPYRDTPKSSKPSTGWSNKDKTTELIKQLVSLTLLEFQKPLLKEHEALEIDNILENLPPNLPL